MQEGGIKSDKYPQECNVYNTQLEPQNRCKEYSLDIETTQKKEKGEESKAQSQPKSLVRKKRHPKRRKSIGIIALLSTSALKRSARISDP